MTMSINKLSVKPGNQLFYSMGFHRYIEGYLKYIRENEIEKIIYIDPHKKYVFEGDLFGLLDQLSIDRKFHWVIMRVNDLTSPMYLDLENTELLLPNLEKIQGYMAKYKTLLDN